MAKTKPKAKPKAKRSPRVRVRAPERVTLPGTDVELVDARMAALLEPIESIVPDPANPRRAKNVPALVAMLRRYGYSDPVVVNGETRVVEAGHQRLAAVTSIGGTHIPVLFTHHGRLDAAGFNVAHNRSSEIVAEWDEEALAKLVRGLAHEDAEAARDLGYDEAALERLLGEFKADESKFPDLTSGTRSDLRLRSFTLSQQQLAIVERALSEAQTRGAMWNPDANNANGNGNAIAAICGLFLGLDIRAELPDEQADG